MEIRERLVESAGGSVGVVTIIGRFTAKDEPSRLKAAVADILQQGATHVVLDLAEVHYIDSTRLGELIAAHITVSRKGGRLKLANTPARVVELLELAALDDVFERFDSVDAALTSFR